MTIVRVQAQATIALYESRGFESFQAARTQAGRDVFDYMQQLNNQKKKKKSEQ